MMKKKPQMSMDADLKEGKPSISIALSVQRKNKKKKKMAMGGMAESDGEPAVPMRKPDDSRPAQDEYMSGDFKSDPKKYDGMSSDKHPSEDEYMAPHFAEGGSVGREKSIAEQIGSPFGPQPPKPSPSPKMARGGSVADAIMHKIKKEMYAEGGQVDIDSNGEEQPNEYYDLNEEALDHNFDSDMDGVSQPMDSNEHSDEIDSDEHDMVNVLRKRIKSRRGF